MALLLGTAETVYDTSAQSILPQVVPRDRLPRANGRLIAAELTANEFVGPPLGGLLVAAGLAAAFATPAALWAAAVGALLLLRGSFAVPREAPTSLRADVAEGLRYLWHHRLLRTLAAMTGLFNFATNATFAVFVLYAAGPSSAMGLTEVGFGLLFATLAAGNLVGALLADPIIRRLGRSRSLFLGILGGVGTVGVAALTTSPLVIAAAFVIGGLTNALWNVVAVSLRQRITPDRILGRTSRRAPRPARGLHRRRRARPRHPARHDPGHRDRHQRRRARPRQLTPTLRPGAGGGRRRPGPRPGRRRGSGRPGRRSG
jgi:predicted MFS family arabinose efflux permease